jgi:dTDP-4-amino-4,6-dideoxygalactose transaminase
MEDEAKRTDVMTGIAVLGGEPTFKESLHVGSPNLGDRRILLDRINNMLDRRWFSNNGPFVQEFESRIAKYVGAKYCVATCNATVALELATRALELKGEVILPSYTFVATAHALQWQEITPVFADIDPHTYNIDPESVRRLITPRTSGIVGVHLWGRPCAMEALEHISKERGLKLIYDAAHAFGCSYRGKMLGGFGQCEVFSFHATKFLSTFEGGAIITNNDALAEKLRLMRNFGFAGYDNVIHLGINGKMTEVCAAMGLASLESIDEFIATNRENYEIYQEEMDGLAGISVIEYEVEERHNYHYIVVRVDSDQSPLTRDELINVLHADNVLARKYFWPGCHRMEPYRSLQPNVSLMLRETERLAAQIIVLPTGQAINSQSIKSICGIIRIALQNAEAVRAALRSRLDA